MQWSSPLTSSPGRRWLRITAATTVVLVAAAIVPAAATTISSVTAPRAADTAVIDPLTPVFDPGFIISDPLFFDFGSMDADDIQAFLDEKVPECSLDSEAPCLRDYTDDVAAVDAIAGRCDNAIAPATAQSAAQIIATVATACEINPQVLLITLQKEQGLITADSVAALKYRKAMGYGCPDTSECNTKYYGFFQQVYWAARAFNSYYAFPATFRFQPNKTATLSYSPKSGCASTEVYLQNRATAALYNYTPYTPNAASLANPFEEGDECSSYGNRNFSLYFALWFSDPTLGRYIVSTGGSSYLVNGDNRWRLPTASVRLASSLRALGASASVSRVYLDSLDDRGSLGPVVRTGGGSPSYFLLSGNTRYALANCAAVQALGFSCDVPSVPKRILAEYATSTALLASSTVIASTTVAGQERRYAIQPAGPAVVRREILDDRSAVAAGITVDPPVELDESVLARIPLANPIIQPGVLFTDAVSGDGYVLTANGTLVVMDRSVVGQTDAAAWFGADGTTVTGSLTTASIRALRAASTTAVRLPPFYSVGGASFVVTSAGALELSDAAAWTDTVVPLAPSVVLGIPTVAAPTAGALYLSTPNGSTVFEVAGGARTEVVPPEGSRIIEVPASTLLAIDLR